MSDLLVVFDLVVAVSVLLRGFDLAFVERMVSVLADSLARSRNAALYDAFCRTSYRNPWSNLLRSDLRISSCDTDVSCWPLLPAD